VRQSKLNIDRPLEKHHLRDVVHQRRHGRRKYLGHFSLNNINKMEGNFRRDTITLRLMKQRQRGLSDFRANE